MTALRSFVALAECLHFGEAARRLNLTQPALTKQIRRLEDDMGATLFERGGRGSKLTSFGEVFLSEAAPLVEHARAVWERGRRAARGEAGRLAIGFSYSTVDIVSRAMPQFRHRYPDVEIELEDLSSATQMDRILAKTLHLGFVRLPSRAGLRFEPIVTDRLALVIPTSMADLITTFDPAYLADLPFVLLHRDRAPGLHDFVMRFCAGHGIQPRKIHYTNETLIALSLVAAEVGVALLHESVLMGLCEGVVVHQIVGRDAQWDVGISWANEDANPLTQKFVDLVISEVKNLPTT
ncbi:LysR family transcriptional regulator [Sphingomonas abietis]|uniref:LysR family transcriptional regulator n=1 Tax=Sphingomonas abietis TaxID=3012344 RepID=A0ABY7NKR4_9SPHN|nr:LysR family transcriptional regulator [Sphingomonas abietis]WBO21560.1 LysR family transcriptional regulator [Sphingomonas abietis]